MATLTVEREIYTGKDEKEYYGYFVRGKLRGREVQADLMPKNKDFDGYAILDIIFDIAPTAQLSIREEESETATGAKTRYTVYEVSNTDEDGITYSYKLKPRAESDKSILGVLLQIAENAEKRAKEVKTE
ncbi:MAG: hypothetical protein HFJ81_01830 [Clostridia bacterium]|nr:hypothetical protein [Clostridia bacterium]